MTDLPKKTVEPQGEQTLINFYKEVSQRLDSPQKAILNELARSIMERGWLPGMASVYDNLDHIDRGKLEAATEQLQFFRLLNLDGGRVTSLLGGISVLRTPHRCHLPKSTVDVFTWGGLEGLAVNPMLAVPVHLYSVCGQCDTPLRIVVEGEAIAEAEPAGVAAFAASWDGASPVKQTFERSPLFCSDACLTAWHGAHPDVDGLPIGGDLMLFIGMGYAQEMGHARYEMIAHG